MGAIPMKNRPASLTRSIRSLAGFLRLAVGMVVDAAVRPRAFRRPAVRLVFHKQIYFTGMQAAFPVLLAALAVGVALETQMRSVLGSGEEVNVRMQRMVVQGEIAPLLTGLIVLGRSGAAMATELANMKVRGEIRLLYLLGIDPGEYLIAPRLLAATLCLPVLTVFFHLVSSMVAPLAASFFEDVQLVAHYRELFSTMQVGGILLVFLKAMVFGLVISSTACATGIHVPPERTWVPQAAEMSVLRGLVGLLAADLVFAFLRVFLK